jgi:GAF domain-containing protein
VSRDERSRASEIDRDAPTEAPTVSEVVAPRASGDVIGAAQLRALLGAVLAIGVDLDLEAVLSRVIRTAVDLVGARYGALGVVDDDGTRLVQFVTVGIGPDERAAAGDPPTGHGVLGTLIADAEPLRVADISRHPDAVGFPPGHPTMTTFLGVPIFIRGDVFGTLYLADKGPGPVGGVAEFSEADEQLVTGLASAAAVAIDNARLHARVREVDLVGDRERIARELHDTVIQRLFATGLSLQAAVRLVDRPEAVERIERTIDDLDETVRQIRYAIFGLQESAADPP